MNPALCPMSTLAATPAAYAFWQLRCDAADFEAAGRAGGHADVAALYRCTLLPRLCDQLTHAERHRLAMQVQTLPTLPPMLPPSVPSVPSVPTVPTVPSARAAQRAALVGPGALSLPPDLTQLHGAHAMGARLRADVQAQRLVGLLGPGGFGKPSLAVEAAHSLAQDSTTGVARASQQPGQCGVPQPFDLVAFVPLSMAMAINGPGSLPDAAAAVPNPTVALFDDRAHAVQADFQLGPHNRAVVACPLHGRGPARALALQRRAITLWAPTDDVHGVNVGRCTLALALLKQRPGCAEAQVLLNQARAAIRASSDALQQAQASNLLGEALCRVGGLGGLGGKP